MNLPEQLPELSPDLHNQMKSWRRHLHTYPECGFDVAETAEFISQLLESWGITVVRSIGKTGVVGVLSCGDSNTGIALRADMDALHIQEQNHFDYCSQHPGKMHACGHDGHCAMLLGAAKFLSHSKTFNGTVYFVFQPDEEHGRGARAMIDDGLFELFSIDEIYGLHNLPGLPAGIFTTNAGPVMASESNFTVEIKGKGGHAAMPHKCIDPILIASQIISAWQTVVSRNLDPVAEPAVISVTEFITDGTVNVIPSSVTLKGDCRCFSDGALEEIRSRMEQITAGICHAAGAGYEFNLVNSFYPTINSHEQTAYALAAAEKSAGRNRVLPDCQPMTISEDFSTMLRVRPGCYMLLGNGMDSEGGCALHNPHYDFNDDILEAGARYWIALVTERLCP